MPVIALCEMILKIESVKSFGYEYTKIKLSEYLLPKKKRWGFLRGGEVKEIF